MSLWIDEKYIALVGTRLGRFHRQSATTYTFRCPFCGDSKRQQNKTRGYFFQYQQRYIFKCHNCNLSLSLRSFLRDIAPELHQELLLDLVRENVPPSPSPTPEVPVFARQPSSLRLPSVASLPSDHAVSVYCRGRQLPDVALNHLYFTDTWLSWIEDMGWERPAAHEDHGPRLVIPWYDRRRTLLGAQFRRIDATGHEGRYITVKCHADAPKVYGLDRMDLTHVVHVVEGPMDSWFLPNCIAAMGSDLLRVGDTYLSTHAAVYVWDNEPRNLMVVKSIERAIIQNRSVVVWPTFVDAHKDLNDMALAGLDVRALVANHTYRGLRAQLEFMRWSKRIR